jgi:TonB family protein
MTREAQIPLFLWIATAVVAHLLWGGGADRAAQVIEEKIEIREFAASVRRFVRGEGRTVEIALLSDEALEPEPEPDAPEDQPIDDEELQEAESTEGTEQAVEPSESVEEEEDDKLEKERDQKKEPEKTEEPNKIEEEEIVRELPAAPERRVAVRQHVEEPDQEDNPDAEFIADQAKKVKEQAQARITSNDQNDPNPTPGGAAHSSNDPNDPGNAEETRVADSENRDGVEDRAPQPKEVTPTELRIAVMPAPARAPSARGEELKRDGAKEGQTSAERMTHAPAQEGALARPELYAAEAVPDTVASPDGTFLVPGERSASIEQKGQLARKKRRLPPLRSSGTTDLLGLGAVGRTAGGVNLNLSPQVAVSTIGQDQLARERRADGERRRSQHAGRWHPVGIERWRSAIENYVAGVKPGNQTALNTARVPFANYLHQIHNRLHPIFAEGFLDSLGDLPGSHPLNRPEITTNLEIVLDRDEGRITRMGVTKTSGVTAFDVAALESVHRAQPFGPPPREIVSPDGSVYFHWEFHRNRDEACSTYFARPFILKGQPKSVPPSLPTPPPGLEPEGQQRHGRRAPASAHEKLTFAARSR